MLQAICPIAICERQKKSKIAKRKIEKFGNRKIAKNENENRENKKS